MCGGEYEDAGISWQERFRDALAEGDGEAVARVLREVDSLDRSAIEALANLFEAGAEDYGPWQDMYPHKLVFKKKRRGKPKDLEKHWVRDPQIANSVERRSAATKYNKTAIYDAASEFDVGRTTVCNAVATAKKAPSS
jgi:hypothetical protein